MKHNLNIQASADKVKVGNSQLLMLLCLSLTFGIIIEILTIWIPYRHSVDAHMGVLHFLGLMIQLFLAVAIVGSFIAFAKRLAFARTMTMASTGLTALAYLVIMPWLIVLGTRANGLIGYAALIFPIVISTVAFYRSTLRSSYLVAIKV